LKFEKNPERIPNVTIVSLYSCKGTLGDPRKGKLGEMAFSCQIRLGDLKMDVPINPRKTMGPSKGRGLEEKQ